MKRCRRCGKEREPDQFPLPRGSCIDCLRADGVLDDMALRGLTGTPEERDAFREMERSSAEGRRVVDELEAEHKRVIRELRPAIRELMLMRQMSEEEAAAWSIAWNAAGRPAPVEPWVYLALGRGVRYDAEARAIVPA
jgi:hypothetical protein